MVTSARRRFIWLITASYGLLALAWIVLSDQLLFALAGAAQIGSVSMLKGLFFVLATAFALYMALSAVPAEPVAAGSAITRRPGQRRIPAWAAYLFAAAVSLAMLSMRDMLTEHLSERALIMMFMLPILLSALAGGLGAGLLSTAMAVLGMDHLDMEPLRSIYVASTRDRLLLGILAFNGIVVSLLVESLQRSLRKSDLQRLLLDSVISGTSDAVYVKDLDGRYLLVNEATARYIGRPAQDIVGKRDFDLFPEATAQRLTQKDKQVLQAGVTSTHEERMKTGQGQSLYFLVTKGPVTNGLGQKTGLFGIAREITARKLTEQELAQAAAVFESSHQGIMIVTPSRQISRVNPAFTRITGYTLEDVQGKTPRTLSSGLHGPEFYRQMWACIARDGFWHGEIWNRRKSGEVYAEMLSISVAHGEDASVQHYIGVFTDISQIKAHEAALDRANHYDALTGLPNRRLLIDRLNQAVLRIASSGKFLAVCFIDLDGFKEINDHHGAQAGDTLLIGVTENLKAVLRGDDTLARLGGDEFVLLLSNMESAQGCTAILDRVLAAVSQPVDIGGGTPVATSASIGVCLYPDDQADPDTLLRHADQAMCLAKEAGKNRYHLYDPDHDRKAQAHRLQVMRLRSALEKNEFQLYYQPKVELRSGRLTGVEALLRWCEPQRGIRPPSEFLPFIAGSDLELPLGRWVIREAIAQAAQWAAQGLEIQVSINIGALQLLDPGFPEDLKAVLSQHPGLPAQRIELEILESAALADMGQAIAVLRQCRQMGVRFALDDFGTGYSSLTYLRKLPLQTLKIDQSFVRDMLGDPDDLNIVESVIKLAATFKLEAVAEGVETHEHAWLLQRMGCHVGQGYGISRPMAAQQLPDWLRQWQEGSNWLAPQQQAPQA